MAILNKGIRKKFKCPNHGIKWVVTINRSDEERLTYCALCFIEKLQELGVPELEIMGIPELEIEKSK